MCVDRQVRKPAGCWYRNGIPDHEKLVVPIYGVFEPQISDSNGDRFIARGTQCGIKPQSGFVSHFYSINAAGLRVH